MSFTFDDGDPSHLDVAVPELDKRGMKATFYLIANQITRKDDWRKLILAGHELGNHSLDHRHPKELSASQQEAQVVGANHVLQKEFGVPLRTFAYPFTETTPELVAAVGKTDFLARNAYGKSYVLKPDMDPDWLAIPSRMTQTKIPFSTYRQWIDEDVQKGGWMVWMIHGLEGTVSGWEPLSKKNFTDVLDKVQSKDIWVGTFLEVGSYFRGQRILQATQPKVGKGQEDFAWDLPPLFPPKVLVKVRFGPSAPGAAEKFVVRQGSKRINPDETGAYLIDIAQKKLSVQALSR